MSNLSLILMGVLLVIAVLPYFVIRQKVLPSGTNLMSEAFPFTSLDLLIGRKRLFYYKANHCKVLIAGKSVGGDTLIVGSLNPANGSENHSNMGIAVSIAFP